MSTTRTWSKGIRGSTGTTVVCDTPGCRKSVYVKKGGRIAAERYAMCRNWSILVGDKHQHFCPGCTAQRDAEMAGAIPF
jgi:hypothetical protein